MHEDYDQVPGWPAQSTAYRELSQFQKSARALKAFREQRESQQAPHPFCAVCICESCNRERAA